MSGKSKKDANFHPLHGEFYYERLKPIPRDIGQLRKEYSAMRAVAQTRLRAFEKAGRITTQEYKYAVEYLKPLKKIRPEDLQAAYLDAQRFLSSKRGSIGRLYKYEREVSRKMQKAGYKFITPDKVEDFGRFMDWWRGSEYAKIYGSDKVREIYDTAQSVSEDVEKVHDLFKEFLNRGRPAD